jgi:hypothetical protein
MKVVVLYAADYHGWALKQSLSNRLAVELQGLMPHLEISYWGGDRTLRG